MSNATEPRTNWRELYVVFCTEDDEGTWIAAFPDLDGALDEAFGVDRYGIQVARLHDGEPIAAQLDTLTVDDERIVCPTAAAALERL